MIQRIKQLLFGTYTDFFEVFNAWLMSALGIWMLLPLPTFETTKAYSTLIGIIPETLFGGILFTAGALSLHSIIKGYINWCKITTLIVMALWIFLGIVVGYANLTSTGIVIFFSLALFTALTYFKK